MPVTALGCAGAIRTKPSPAFLNVSLVRNRLTWFTCRDSFLCHINRIALLRNSRDNGLPDLVACARIVLDAGADGITVHPRLTSSIRPVTCSQSPLLVREFPGAEFNVEGNPHHNLVQIVESLAAAQPCSRNK